MKKLLSMILVASTVCFVGCSGASNTADKADNKEANLTYKTEDVKITNGDEALNKLKEGNQRFVNDEYEAINVTSERRKELLDGQSPYATILSCSDSRVTPTTVFDAGLGEIFDIRVAGNVVDADELGSIEYAVEHLQCPLLVIMGHESCGAVTAAYDALKKGEAAEGNISSLVSKIQPIIKDCSSLDESIHANLDHVYELVNQNEIVKHLVSEGKLKVVKAYYSLDGKVDFQ